MFVLSRRSVLGIVGLAVLVLGGTSFFFIRSWFFGTQPLKADVLIYGGSLGGISTALALAEDNKTVVLATENTVIGGQAVESGISAFDDLSDPWDDTQLYREMAEYLREKYQTSHPGLGASVVGTVASPAADIQAFFLDAIAKHPSITLLTNQQFVRANKKKGRYVSATLEEKKTGAKIQVRFSYLVSASQTGLLLKELDEPFAVSFDAAEDTKEPSALPADIRAAFQTGTQTSAKQIFTGWGKRVQSISSPFALLDKGYAGDFFPIDRFPDADCWSPSNEESFIIGAPVSRSAKASCTAQMSAAPGSSDVYDAYFINHGATELEVTVRWPTQKNPLVLSLKADPEERFVRIGSFFIHPANPPVFTFGSSSPLTTEGVILVKSNLQETQLSAAAPFSETFTMYRSGLPLVSADLYLLTKEGASVPEPFSLTLNAETLQAERVGKNTYRVEDVVLGSTGAFVLPAKTRDVLTDLLLVPTSLSSRRMSFTWPSDDETPKKTAWDFTVRKSGDYVLSIDWTQKIWIKLSITESKTGKEIVAFGHQPQYPKRFPEPIRVVRLTAGKFYRLEVDPLTATAAQWNPPPVLSLESLESSNYLFASSPNGSARVTSFPATGLYDAWVRSPAKSVTLLSSLLFRRNAKVTLPLQQSATFTYAGKFFQFNVHDLTTNGGNELLVRPSTDDDVYHVQGTVKDNTLVVDLGFLPPGRWSAVFGTLNASDIAEHPSAVIRHASGAIHEQDLPLSSVGYSLITAQSFSHQGPATLTVSGIPAEIRDVWFYEEIPDLQPSWQFALLRDVFMTPVPDAPAPLFAFRNIVSSGSLIAGKFTLPGLPPAARSTLGATIVAEPSNDYSPVFSDSIESKENTEKSRALSYTFYYWMKTMVPDLRTLGRCTKSPSCSMKRISLLLGMFPGSEDIFAIQPYYREGRRAETLSRVTENDLSLSLRNCTEKPDACSQDVCLSEVMSNAFCIQKQQDAKLPSDAIAAVHYGIDLHAYYTQAEYFAKDGLSDFIQYYRNNGQLKWFAYPILVKFISYVRPSSVTMGALIPRETENLLAVSSNIGTTQIANGATRTHVNEMVIGQSAGHLLSYCLEQEITPAQLREDPVQVRALQHALIERGSVIYPINDMNADPTLRKAVQHLLVDGLITPSLVPFYPPSAYNSFAFVVHADEPLSDEDGALMKRIWMDAHSVDAVSPQKALTLFPQAPAQDSSALLSLIGFTEGKPAKRAHLLRIIYLAKGKELKWY